MKKYMKIAVSLLSVALIGLVTVAETPSSFAASKTEAATIEANGKTMKVLIVEEQLPVAQIVKMAGDRIVWDNKTQTATTHQNNTVIEVSANRSIVRVNGEDKPLTTKIINGVSVPSGEKSTVVDGRLYVPIDTIEKIFGYKVKVNKMEGDEMDLAYPTPDDWILPRVKSTATEDYQKNRIILENEMGFQKGVWYNPYGQDAYESLGRVRVGLADGAIANIDFLAWYGDKNQEHVSNTIPYVSRELFRFYLPTEYIKLFKIMDDGYSGKDISKYIDKPFKLDGRKITITENQKSVTVKISKK